MYCINNKNIYRIKLSKEKHIYQAIHAVILDRSSYTKMTIKILGLASYIFQKYQQKKYIH